MDHLPGVADLFQIAAGVVTAAESKRAPGHSLVERLTPGGELGANGGADEVRSVGVEAFLDQEIDLSEVDESQVDGDFFGLLTLTGIHRNHLLTIWMDGN